MTVRECLRDCARQLRAAGVEEADLEAELLLRHVLGVSRTRLYLAAMNDLADELLPRLDTALHRRLCREPLAHITGEREFWSLSFAVCRDVLIPRPETEFMLEQALVTLRREGCLDPVLDVGTGSGAIAVVLARELAGVPVVAMDISTAALAVARGNAKRHGVEGKVSCVQADLRALPFAAPCFAAVFANLPYIPAADIAALSPEVRDYEPRLALDGGQDGGDLIVALARQLPAVVKPGGRVYFEIGADQKELAMAIFEGIGRYGGVEVLADHADRPRVLTATVTG